MVRVDKFVPYAYVFLQILRLLQDDSQPFMANIQVLVMLTMLAALASRMLHSFTVDNDGTVPE